MEGVQPGVIAQRLAFQAFQNSVDKDKLTPYRWGGAVWVGGWLGVSKARRSTCRQAQCRALSSRRPPARPPPVCSEGASEAFDMVFHGGKQDDITVLCAAMH